LNGRRVRASTDDLDHGSDLNKVIWG